MFTFLLVISYNGKFLPENPLSETPNGYRIYSRIYVYSDYVIEFSV